MPLKSVETAICDRCGKSAPTTGGHAPPAWRWFWRSDTLEPLDVVSQPFPFLICPACNKSYDTWFSGGTRQVAE